jgi:hypothetical protein
MDLASVGSVDDNSIGAQRMVSRNSSNSVKVWVQEESQMKTGRSA